MSREKKLYWVICSFFTISVLNLIFTFSITSIIFKIKLQFLWLKSVQPGMYIEDVERRTSGWRIYLKKGEVAKPGDLYENVEKIRVEGVILYCIPTTEEIWRMFPNEKENTFFTIFPFLSSTWIVINKRKLIEKIYWGF